MSNKTSSLLVRVLWVLLALAWVGTAGAETVYYLRADVTTVTMPDNTVVPMWGFARDTSFESEDGTVTVPGPRLSVPAGDTLTIHVKNKLTAGATGFGADVPVSLVIPGQTAVMTPVRWGATPYPEYTGRVRSLTHEAQAGNTTAVTYTWPSVKAGTFAYHSGTHMQVQVQMGLYGCVTVNAAPGEAYSGVPFDAEAVLVYSEIDPALHAAVSTGAYGPGKTTTSTFNYRPRYYLVNGAPYTAATGPVAAVSTGDRVLLRLVNLGIESHVALINGPYATILAEDGNPYPVPKEQYSVFLPAGKTADALLVPDKAGSVGIYDRMLCLTNGGEGMGGLYAFLEVNAAGK